jgi:hypothetical protein
MSLVFSANDTYCFDITIGVEIGQYVEREKGAKGRV